MTKRNQSQLRQLRLNANYVTQDDARADIGCSFNVVSRAEMGHSLGARVAQRMADIYHVPVATIWKEFRREQKARERR